MADKNTVINNFLQFAEDGAGDKSLERLRQIFKAVCALGETEPTEELFGECLDALRQKNPHYAASGETGAEEGLGLYAPGREKDEWAFALKMEDMPLAQAFENYLKAENFIDNVREKMNQDSLNILSHMPNPKSESEFSGKGLVVGNVQSGKTINYLNLIARAADAGYRLVIILTGIHENLRQQTQKRADAAIVQDYSLAISLTTANDKGDIDKKSREKINPGLIPDDKALIIVAKKNVNSLKELKDWLKDIKKIMGDPPLLLIDDEADNASINTNANKKKETDPTTINRLIVEILGEFKKSSYVGYTATPFANIFIDPDAPKDLFPKDFIYLLKAPQNYFGPKKVFLEESSKQILQEITDCEEFIPLKQDADFEPDTLPPSLKEAFLVFLLARAIRNLLGQEKMPASMVVNVSYRRKAQQKTRELLEAYSDEFWETLDGKAGATSKEALLEKLRKLLLRQYPFEAGHWQEIAAALPKVKESLRFFTINSVSKDRLDYAEYFKEHGGKQGLTAVAVGGYSLSRGLTLEGLTVSYLYRNTKLFDTLLQMGRWFGYRDGYEDLCRVWLSPESIGWYTHIAKATEELFRQFEKMAQAGKTPQEFGFFVETYPPADEIREIKKAWHYIVSRDKIGAAREGKAGPADFGGQKYETRTLPANDSINRANEELLKLFWETRGDRLQKTKGGLIEYDIPLDDIIAFLRAFQVHDSLKLEKQDLINYLGSIKSRWPNGDLVLVSPEKASHDFESRELGRQKRSKFIPVKDGFKSSQNRDFSDRVVEKIGLMDDQIRETEERVKNDKTLRREKAINEDFRKTRGKPLLMLHMLDIHYRDNGENKSATVPAFGISFPENENAGDDLTVVGNKKFWDERRKKQPDAQSEEEWQQMEQYAENPEDD